MLTIPTANWLIGHVGTVCTAQGVCLIPVLPGVLAPSGVILIGVALLLRDFVQIRYGKLISFICIICGAGLSAFVAPTSLALASGVTFLFSEITDFLVFTPISKRSITLAIALSCFVGAAVDSALFLWFAFGSLSHIVGLIIGKIYAMIIYTFYNIIRKKYFKIDLKIS